MQDEKSKKKNGSFPVCLFVFVHKKIVEQINEKKENPTTTRCNYGLQACVDVSHLTLLGIKLFDWDRTGEHDPLGRFALLIINLFKYQNLLAFDIQRNIKNYFFLHFFSTLNLDSHAVN